MNWHRYPNEKPTENEPYLIGGKDRNGVFIADIAIWTGLTWLERVPLGCPITHWVEPSPPSEEEAEARFEAAFAKLQEED